MVASAIGLSFVGLAVVYWTPFSGFLTSVWTLQLWLLILIWLGWVIAVVLAARLLFSNKDISTTDSTTFSPFEFEDEGTQLYWRVAVDPSHWLDSDVQKMESTYTSSILQGPFCKNSGCRGPLTIYPNHSDSCVASTCNICDARQISGGQPLWKLRDNVLHAIQRFERRGSWHLAPQAVINSKK